MFFILQGVLMISTAVEVDVAMKFTQDGIYGE